jgi:hypothetical protein
VEMKEQMTRTERTKLNRELQPQGKKCCSKCGEIKSLDDFYVDRKRNGFLPRCIECVRKPIPNIPFLEMSQGERKAFNERMKSEGKKCCNECGEIKPFSEYYQIKHKNRPESKYYSSICNKCAYTTRKEYLIEYMSEYSKTYTPPEESIEKRKEYRRQYRIKNADKIKQDKKEWKLKNPDYHTDYMRERRKTDPEFRFYELTHKHIRTVVKRQEFKVIWDDVREVYDFYDIPYHIDHKVPKNWFKVGSPKKIINHLDNLQVIDAQYNLSKGDRWSDPIPQSFLELARPYLKKIYLTKVLAE